MYTTLSFLLASIAIILGLTIIQSLLFAKDFKFLLRAPQTLEKLYVRIFDTSLGDAKKLMGKQKKNVPFIIKTSQTRYVAVSSPGHIYELSNAPAEKLSLIAFFSEVIQV